MINLIDKNTVDCDVKINYKCKQCGNGSMDIGLILIKDTNIDENFQNEKYFKEEKDNEKKIIKIYKTDDGNNNINDENYKNFNKRSCKNQTC